MDKKNSFQFNMIAPIYGLFYNKQKKNYSKDIASLNKYLDLSKFNTIIDVGCGTGALCSVLNEMGFSVTGIDPAIKMLKIGARKKENVNIRFVTPKLNNKLPFDDKSYDISFASYVAHGLEQYERIKLYEEMSRVSKDYVILYDYNNKRSWVTNIVETIENGDYFNFIRSVKVELKENFKTYVEIKLRNQTSWYICEPFNKF